MTPISADNALLSNKIIYENDIFSVSDTGILGKRNSEFSQQESNLRPSDYYVYFARLDGWHRN